MDHSDEAFLTNQIMTSFMDIFKNAMHFARDAFWAEKENMFVRQKKKIGREKKPLDSLGGQLQKGRRFRIFFPSIFIFCCYSATIPPSCGAIAVGDFYYGICNVY